MIDDLKSKSDSELLELANKLKLESARHGVLQLALKV